MGALGFTIVDNGMGYTQNDLSIICRCLPERERNEIYKTKSIGYRGEALQSLCKAAKISITTKHEDEPNGIQVTFNQRGDIETLNFRQDHD